MPNFFCGIDASFIGLGLIILDENINIVENQLISTKPTGSEYDIEFRVKNIINELNSILGKYSQNKLFIYIEGVSFNSKGQSIVQQAVLNYSIKMWLMDNNIEYKSISPTSLKKFITGTGKCKKNLMLLKIYKKFGIEFDNDNIADAYGLARMCFELEKKF
jgi:crossover junction endodeoxyribonuclease RuvC